MASLLDTRYSAKKSARGIEICLLATGVTKPITPTNT